MHHSKKNAILTKLSPWEYGNGDAPFSRQKSDKVSRLVCYGAPIGFHACVYGSCQHAYARMSQSLSKYQAYWCVLHTRGNQFHLVTWIGMVIRRWFCTQYNINMDLQQFLWAHTNTIRSRTLMAREGRSPSHEGPSYKVHNHPYTSIYRYTYIMHNDIIQSGKVNRHCQCPKGMA